VKFFADYNNLALLAVAIVSGLLLLWAPIQRRIAGGGGAKVSAPVATQLINRRNAVVVDVRESGEYEPCKEQRDPHHPRMPDRPARRAGPSSPEAGRLQ
jgi:hypothetical protein